MNSRKLFALFMVFALTGGALAAQQQNTYSCDKVEADLDGDGVDPHCDPLEAEDVTAIQQHSVFVEIVVQEQDRENVSQIHEFAAVVGLVKKCKIQDNVRKFDNAVLWFNDQFLFGDKDKDNRTRNETRDFNNPNETGSGVGEDVDGDGTADQIGFYKRNGVVQARWGGCFIPDGFVHAIGEDDPLATGTISDQVGSDKGDGGPDHDEQQAEDRGDNVCDDTDDLGVNPPVPNRHQLGLCSFIEPDNIDAVKQLISLDNTCGGCIFEYQSSFFVTDPNNHQWIVDKLVYPLSIGDVLGTGAYQGGNAFAEPNCSGSGNNQGNGTVPASDPRDNYPHHDRCEDDAGEGEEDNHCTDGDTACNGTGEDPSNNVLVEPIFTVHTQVNPTTLQGFADKATWAYSDGTTRPGLPYADDPNDGNFEGCKNGTLDQTACAIEYDFLITVDFAAFDTLSTEVNSELNTNGEGEVVSDSVHHGDGAGDSTDSAEDGNSHAHNPQQNTTAGDKHTHDAVDLDLFFYEEAPYFVESNPYWDDFGQPPTVTSDCSAVASNSPNASPSQQIAQDNAVEARTPIVCDVDADDGFHLHDGSQTVS